MAITIEGFCVVAQKKRLEHLLADGLIEAPNATSLSDEHLWKCSFMASSDADKFICSLEELGLNVNQGPDSDVVVVSEFDQSIEPYCEWLNIATWEKAVIAWLEGTAPESITAHEGWDPKVGSGLTFKEPNTMDNLEFLRLDDNVEVYLNKETGEELYIGRTATPLNAMFKMASRVIKDNYISAGQKPLTGEAHAQVKEAVEMLDKVIEDGEDSWSTFWFHGKGHLALGNHELAYKSLSRAYDMEKGEEVIPRELSGVCLELQRFDEAATISEEAVVLIPDNPELIGNLSLTYLLAGRVAEARKSIDAAIKLDSSDKINNHISRLIAEVAEGTRPQPHSLSDLQKPAQPEKKSFWKFW